MSLCCKTKTNAPLMHEVPNKDMMKSEIMPHSSVAKHGYVPEGDLAEVIPYVLYKLKAWLSMADYFCFSMMSSWLVVSNMPHSRSCWLL